MAFMVDPNAPSTGGGGGGKRRPEVRAGKKLVWCADIEYGRSNAGNDKIDTRWCVVDDPEGGADLRGLFYDTLTLSERAAWRVQQLAKALGQTAPWDAMDPEATWAVLTRRPVWVTLVPDTYNGKTRVKVQEFSLYGGEVTEAMEDIINEAEQWCREGKAKRAANGGGGRGGAQTQGTPYTGSGGHVEQDEDIPF
jgi:hypothetical protein